MDPHRQRYGQLRTQIRDAQTVETVDSLVKDVENDRSLLGEDNYKTLRSLIADQYNKVGKRKAVGHLGPLGQVGVEKEGKLI
jgi:hypothetical protein